MVISNSNIWICKYVIQYDFTMNIAYQSHPLWFTGESDIQSDELDNSPFSVFSQLCTVVVSFHCILFSYIFFLNIPLVLRCTSNYYILKSLHTILCHHPTVLARIIFIHAYLFLIKYASCSLSFIFVLLEWMI